MIQLQGPRMHRGRRIALVAILLGCGRLDALAQSPCDHPDVKQYIADFSGVRTGPPAVWQACIDSLGLDPRGDHKREILRAFAVLRARSAPPRVPDAAEKRFFQGSGSDIRITAGILDGWRVILGVRRADQRFESVFYQALLGAMAWMVVDRSKGLEVACVAPSERLRRALRGGPSWLEIEDSLLGLSEIPLWEGAGVGGLTLTSLRDQASRLGPANLQRACPAVRQVPPGRGYWPAVSHVLRNVAPEIACRAPSGCRMRSCQVADEWCRSQTPESWTRFLRTFDDDLEKVRQRADSIRNALPAGVSWGSAHARLESLQEHSRRLHGSGGPDGRGVTDDVQSDLAILNRLAAQLERLDTVLACDGALKGLLKGNLRQAKEALRGREDWRGVEPRLAAVYVAVSYWENGTDGRSTACQKRGINCSGEPLAGELRTVERILGLQGQLLGP